MVNQNTTCIAFDGSLSKMIYSYWIVDKYYHRGFFNSLQNKPELRSIGGFQLGLNETTYALNKYVRYIQGTIETTFGFKATTILFVVP